MQRPWGSMRVDCSRTIKEASVAEDAFIRGRIKETRVIEIWDVGPAGSLHPTIHTPALIVNVVGSSRGIWICLMQSNFNPIQEPERDLALLGRPCSKRTCAEQAC